MYSEDHTQQYLFIINGHNSYIITNFIAFCMEYLIDLFFLFLYIWHLFQLLNVSVLTLLKCILITKIDAIFLFNFDCILHADSILILI